MPPWVGFGVLEKANRARYNLLEHNKPQPIRFPVTVRLSNSYYSVTTVEDLYVPSVKKLRLEVMIFHYTTI